jgi:hypothetical protein
MFWSNKKRSPRRQRWPLSMPLVPLSSEDDFTLADAAEGVFIQGNRTLSCDVEDGCEGVMVPSGPFSFAADAAG